MNYYSKYLKYKKKYLHTKSQVFNQTGGWNDKVQVGKENYFYYGKIENRDLYFVLERVTDENKPLWMKYINVQTEQNSIRAGKNYTYNNGKIIMPGFSENGSAPFKQNLKKVDLAKNELWIAYITTSKNIKPITENKNIIESYSFESLPKNEKPFDATIFPGNILMFVTIITAPKALITSHMGVSVSIEGIFQRKFDIGKQISMDLHSAGAKVMRIINKDRKYMINEPTHNMEKIILTGMPKGTCFAGTRQMKMFYERWEKMTFDEFKIELEKNPLLGVWCYTPYEEYSDDKLFECVKKNYIEIPGWDRIKTYKDFWKEYPPIIGVDDPEGRRIFNSFTVYEPNTDNIWLSVNKGEGNGLNYDFMFQNVIINAATDHLIAVDLEALANARTLDNY